MLSRIVILPVLALSGLTAWCQELGSLKAVPVPQQPGLEKYVRDREALVVLGKALFWDMQVGSDSQTACATCHFHAGADHRAQKQLSNPTGAFVPNYVQTLSDFPFHALADAGDNRSAVVRDSSQRAGSAGVFRRMLNDISTGGASDDGFDATDLPAFTIAGRNVRQVTIRNTPTVINSVFNLRNFWDGRASDIFSGLTPFGESDTRANALVVANGLLAPQKIRIENSSLASQAVGPPLSNIEMSYDGRTWPKLGKRMLVLRPLALQKVAADDSVLGALANPDGRGLLAEHTYLSLIQRAFQPEYWDSTELADAAGQALGRQAPAQNTTEFTLTEYNFALFFGLAVQAYEATLVSDDTRFDRFAEGEAAALTAQEQNGMRVFRGNECADCHTGPEFTIASFTAAARRGRIERSRNGLSAETGFFRTGVRPISDDTGLGGTDDFGKPFSQVSAQGVAPGTGGAFKTSGLRNIEFTGPYFHNGGQATLEQVVEFYNRGGDFPDGGNLSPDVRRLNLSAADRAALVAFLKSLSDDRVRFERAPFDHPELCVPVGHGDAAGDDRFPLSAPDRWAAIPAVGRGGNTVPLQTFDELLQGIGVDGSRAHNLRDACVKD